MKPHTKLATAKVFSGTALLLLAALALAAAPDCMAQTAAAPAHRAARRPKPRAAKEPDPAPAAAVPVVPPKPNWPVNDPPRQPDVSWDAQGLSIQAANASLRQILDDVTTRTGTRLEGLNKDERIFGTYGPGPAKDVISQLLHGTSYNVLMLGDVGQGAPREIVLSARSTNAGSGNRTSQPNPSQSEDEDQPEPEEPQPQPIQPQVMQQPNGGPTPGPLHTPQERMQEMQRQQMEMQRQQQQQLQQLQQQQNQQQNQQQ
jgi:hypothetical protein